MEASAPVSVLLPTVRRAEAIEEVAAQLEAEDELLVVCDDTQDPVAGEWETMAAHADERVRLVMAGEPAGCSGKANAIAAGMEAARHERLVWTDDDFHHPPGWPDELRSDYERDGPVTEVPVFEGHDPLSIALEPLYALVGTAGVAAGDVAWGGAVCFDRSDLPDAAAFRADLRRTVSDDGLLTDVLDELRAAERTRTIPVGGNVRASLERHVRFSQIVRHHDPTMLAVLSLALLAFVAGAVAFPLVGAASSTAVVGAAYARFGIRRWTFLLAFPTLLAQLPLAAYALGRRTFVWGGRRYRWRSKFDVEVVDGP